MINADSATIRDHFIGWQCRIRQIAMRQDGGRPSPGMCPRVLACDGRELLSAMAILIIPQEPAESTAFFRFQVQKSIDPQLIYERGLAFLQSAYFQKPGEFSDRMTAVLPAGSPTAATLVRDGECTLEFDQFRQTYRLACTVGELSAGDPAHAASLWHNRLFNPNLPDAVHVLAFQPDWATARAEPGP